MWNPFSPRRKQPPIAIKTPEKVAKTSYARLLQLTIANKWLERTPDALAELWNLCDTASQHDLVESLLSKLLFVDSAMLGKYGQGIAEVIVKEWKLPAASTILSATCDNANADGSQALLQSIKNKFPPAAGWSEESFHNSLPVSAHRVKDNSNVVLLDDFIGTGKTIERKLNWHRKTVVERGVKNVHYFVVALAAMKAAQTRLNDLGVPYAAAEWLEKGISYHWAGAGLAQAKTDMKTLEKKLAAEWRGRELSLFNFGYGKSEALFYMEPYNVPNNVFPLLWWPPLADGVEREVLFSRLSP